MRQVNLNNFSGGVNRLRTKGGASEKMLYVIKNGYVTHENTVQSRPGTKIIHTLPAGTIGLAAFQGKLHVFASSAVTMTDARFVCDIIKHPIDSGGVLYEIHKALPFCGHLYVVAEFTDGNIYHYWLKTTATWAASTDYRQNDLVVPSTPNGYAYRARRLGSAYPLWAAGTVRAVNDIVEPGTYNGFYFQVSAVYGTNPHSGVTEPAWNASAGALTYEDTDGQQQAPIGGTGTPVTPIGTVPITGPGGGGYDPVNPPGDGFLEP